MEKTGQHDAAKQGWLVPGNLKYDRNNFWVRCDGNMAVIGLTDYGQWTIGDILYLETAESGWVLSFGKKFGSIESGKWVGNLLAPLSCTVIESNPLLKENPGHINEAPYAEGWLLTVILHDAKEMDTLMDPTVYARWVDMRAEEEKVL
ncbi:glycine cleavage system protein H [Desulfoluna limicola]|nr:hypothetical protein [Desulfoluna limicola]